MAANAVPSLLRGFSAPVNLDLDLTNDELLVLARLDNDPYNRWQSLQTVAMRRLKQLSLVLQMGQVEEPGTEIAAAIGALLADGLRDPAFTALALALPSEADIAREIAEDVDTDAVFLARRTLRGAVAVSVKDLALATYHDTASNGAYAPDALAAGRRALRLAALDLALTGGHSEAPEVAWRQFQAADNMTERFGALAIMVHGNHPRREEALAQFEHRHGSSPLVMDKWFACRPRSPKRRRLSGSVD